MAETRDTRDVAAHVVDLDLDPPIVGILAAPLPLHGGVDHLTRRQRHDAGARVSGPLHQLRVKRALHSAAIVVEPALHVIEHHSVDRLDILRARRVSYLHPTPGHSTSTLPTVGAPRRPTRAVLHPGSSYGHGDLLGAIVDLSAIRKPRFLLVDG